MATYVNVNDARGRLMALLGRVAAGEDVVLVRAGRPIARLGPLAAPRRLPWVPKRQMARRARRPGAPDHAPRPERLGILALRARRP